MQVLAAAEARRAELERRLRAAEHAYLGGTIVNTLLTTRSGRFGHESTVTPQHLENAADLFNCYGIKITDTEFVTN